MFTLHCALRTLFFVWTLCGLTACAAAPLLPPATAVALPSPTPSPVATASLPTATRPLPPSTTASVPTPTLTPTATSIPEPRLDPELVRVYPLPPASGDWLSFDIEPVLSLGYDAPFTVTLALPDGRLLSRPVVPVGFDRQPRARFVWVWDTTGLSGSQSFTVTLLAPPDVRDSGLADNVLTLEVPLQNRTVLPPPEPGARWDLQSAAGIQLHYVTGSAAERDAATLLALAQSAYADVAARLGVTTTEALDIYAVDRVVGQGGYATSDWVAISYTDRAYAPAEMTLLLRHELTHRLDSAWECDTLPVLFREGLAVWVAGGHYWPESLPRKTAGLLQIGRYIPLEQLLGDFYRQQHEIGYLEAGALVAYIVEERGLEGVQRLCGAFAAAQGDEPARLAAGLTAVDLPAMPQLEQEWLRWLRSLHISAEELRILEGEWLLMDTMRLYQQLHDPSANFLTGILFDPAAAVERGITADLVRRPRDPEAVALELLLQMTQEALRAGDSEEAAYTLEALRVALHDGTSAAPEVVIRMRALVEAVMARGYEPYRTICFEDAVAVGQRAPGCVVYALDRSNWPTKRLLWAARGADLDSWTVVGPQLEN